MKKVNYLFLCGLLSIVAFSFSACSDDDNNVDSPKSIVGTWIMSSNEGWVKENGKTIEEWNDKVDEDESLHYIYHRDGTLEYKDPSDGYQVVEPGTWRYEDGKIYLTENGDDYITDLISVSETELVLGIHGTKVEDGITYEYYAAKHFRKIADAL